MAESRSATLVEAIDRVCMPLNGDEHDYDDLLEAIGNREVVLLGEATHGTHEFYRERARITSRLIEELGFTAVAVEADWADAYRVNRYVSGLSDDTNADDALGDFNRFPVWMWRNREMADFVEWLWLNNVGRAPNDRVRFYGLDLYGMHASMEAVIAYLEKVDPAAATRARERYSCFDATERDGQAYGASTRFGLVAPCENEVVSQLMELRHSASEYLARNGWVGRDELFFAEQNALVVRSAEQYYREMFREGSSASWNLRDLHMSKTLEALRSHLRSERGQNKVVVWEHNSHVGDARATSMGSRGKLNVGQIVRQTCGADDVFLVGFTTYDGTVTAASDWGQPVERKRVRAAIPGSCEDLFHEVGHPRFLLRTRLDDFVADGLREPRLQRAIGVLYRPDTELPSHYLETHLADQFDAVIHIDHTSALEPLERTSGWEDGEPPDTYPTGI
jgi:erythromycin esterase-like protein